MAKIQSVDYEAIPGKASSMRTTGQQMNTELLTIYRSIASMHAHWQGKRYQALAADFNSLIPQLNEMLTLVVGDIPFALETVANNYAKVDTGASIVTATQTAPTKLVELRIAVDVGMKFITTEVETVQKNVSTNFDNVKSYMNTISETLGQVTWDSEAATAFRTKFTSLRNSIDKSIDNIKTSFVNLMTQAQNDIQAAETSNTVQQ